MSIFLGLTDIASQISDLKKGFASIGVETYAAVLENRAITENAVNKVLFKENLQTRFSNRLFRTEQLARFDFRRRKFLHEMAQKHDTFIFVWETFLANAEDLAYLKKLGKKIVFFFVGSEQRWKNAYAQEMEQFGIPSYFSYLDANDYENKDKKLAPTLKLLRQVEKYADVIYSLPNQSQLSLRPYQHFYILVDTEIIRENVRQREIPVVFHAPSSRAHKGTHIVLDALEKLRSEGVKFETKLIENVPYLQALEMYSDADIAVGELFIPSAGKFDREALAAGKIVLSSVCRDYIDNLPADCPIIDVRPDTLYEELKKIISDYPRRVELARQGRRFVEKYHKPQTICLDVLRRLESSAEETENFDFYPTFFRERFAPENKQSVELYNRSTRFVGDADWYKKYVPKGERDGLVF